MLLTDREQIDLLTDGPTTQKINKRLSDFQKDELKKVYDAYEGLSKQLRPVVEKQDEQEGVLTFIRRKLGVKRRAS